MLRQPCQRRQPGPQSPAPRPRGRQRSSCLRTRHGASHCKWGGKGGEGGGVRGGGWHSGRIKCAFGKERTTYTMEARDFAPALREAAAIAAADALRAAVSPSAPSKAVRGASYADIGAESQGAVKSLEWRRGAKKKKKKILRLGVADDSDSDWRGRARSDFSSFLNLLKGLSQHTARL